MYRWLSLIETGLLYGNLIQQDGGFNKTAIILNLNIEKYSPLTCYAKSSGGREIYATDPHLRVRIYTSRPSHRVKQYVGDMEYGFITITARESSSG